MTGFAARASGTSRAPRWPALLLLAAAIRAGSLVADEQGDGAVAWGHEQAGGALALEVPFSTPHRDRIEVVAAFRYTDRHLLERDAMMQAWRASLPPSVELLRVPLVWEEEEGDSRSLAHRRAHRNALLAGRFLGIEEEVHSALVKRLHAAPESLGTEALVRSFLVELGTAPSDYETVTSSVAFESAWWEASTLGAALRRAEAESQELVGMPWLLINGRHVTSSRQSGSAAATLRVANRLVRETLEAGPPFHDGPTDIPELIERLEQWSGEHLTNARTGNFRGVYNPWRRELWSFDEAGDLRAVARAVHGRDAFWQWRSADGRRSGYTMNWRAGLHYAPRAPRVRHGAFLLADWLSTGRVVELDFKRHPTGLSFGPDGRVEARSGKGPVRGTWWLEAGALHVSLGEYGIDSWAWRRAAAQAGLEVGPESVVPWRLEATGPATADKRMASGTTPARTGREAGPV